MRGERLEENARHAGNDPECTRSLSKTSTQIRSPIQQIQTHIFIFRKDIGFSKIGLPGLSIPSRSDLRLCRYIFILVICLVSKLAVAPK